MPKRVYETDELTTAKKQKCDNTIKPPIEIKSFNNNYMWYKPLLCCGLTNEVRGYMA
jgi:hypothetical protein